MTPSTDHTVLTAMLAPAFFLTATASLLLSANNRLARIIDRARTLLRELGEVEEDAEDLVQETLVALARQAGGRTQTLSGSQSRSTAVPSA